MENSKNENIIEKKPENNGGLYKNVKMSVKTANILILIGVAAFFTVIVFLVSHNGFTVTFDTNGGSQVESVKVMHSEKVNKPENPVKEGYHFTGWYTDENCTSEWKFDTDTVTESITLYAGFEKTN